MVLRGLRQYAHEVDLVAVVNMTDSGGSTGRLRDAFGHLPVGDIRNALAALAATDDETALVMRELFSYRFIRGDGLSGHTIGNLLITGLTELLGSELAAIDAVGKILRVCGTVVPVTTSIVDLEATYDDGAVIRGEAAIDVPAPDRHDRRITALRLVPAGCLYERVVSYLKTAALVVVSPGDLYTSLIPVVLPAGMREALAQCPAPLLMVGNLMTRPGQTTGMDAGDHLREWSRYSGRMPDALILNGGMVPADLRARYEIEGEYVIEPTGVPETVKIITADLLWRPHTTKAPVSPKHLVRHDGVVVASLIRGFL
jgi:uncharacterized cofD-like protein